MTTKMFVALSEWGGFFFKCKNCGESIVFNKIHNSSMGLSNKASYVLLQFTGLNQAHAQVIRAMEEGSGTRQNETIINKLHTIFTMCG